MKFTENRMDSSLLTEADLRLLAKLIDLTERDSHPYLKGADGTEIRLPDAIYAMLVQVLQAMRHGKAIVLMPEDETFTTQASANFLGMSRQFFVTLLESGQIPFHRVGTHRRVAFKDLRDYAERRDTERRTGLEALRHKVKAAGLYDASYTGEDAG